MKSKDILTATFVFVALLWGTAIFNSAVSALPFNPLTGSKIDAMEYNVLLPQGWAFFTRNPREEQYYVYKEEGKKLVPLLYTNSSYKNAFGFTRKVRIRGVEMGGLVSQLEQMEWLKCEDGILSECVIENQDYEAIILANNANHPTFCGNLWIEKKPLVPWAWSRAEQAVNMPSEFIKINVSCK